MKKQVVVVSCDLCGDSVKETHVRSDPEFSIEGAAYRLDLCPRHAGEFAAAIAPFVTSGRRSGGVRRSVVAKAGASSDLKAVREWAHAHGFQVSTRGRVASEILAAYSESGGASGAGGVKTPGSARGRITTGTRSGGNGVRSTTSVPKRTSPGNGGSAGIDLRQVREWARGQGRQIGDRGRIPAEVVDAYRASSSGSDGNVISLSGTSVTARQGRGRQARAHVAAATS